MSKPYIYLAGGIILLLVIAGGYLLLSKSNIKAPSSYNPETSQTETSTPITADNADESLGQTDSNMEDDLDSAEAEINSAQEIESNAQAQEDLNSINSL